MNTAIFRLFPCLLAAKQNKTKGMKEISKSSVNTGRKTAQYEQWTFKETECLKCNSYLLQFSSHSEKRYSLETQYCPLSIACCDLLVAIFVMLKILRLLFAVRIELVNSRHLAPVKTKPTTEVHEAYWLILGL